MITFVPSVPRNAWHSAVELARPPRRYRPIAPSPSQTSSRGTAPSACDQLPPPGEQVLRARERDQQRRAATASTRSPSSAPATASPVRVCPNPTGTSIVGEPQIALRDLPGHIARARRRIRRQIRPGAARATRSLNTVIPRGPADPLRDHRRRHRRIRPQQLPDPRLDLIHDRPRRPPLDTSVGHRWPTPPAPCSSRSPSPARSP